MKSQTLISDADKEILIAEFNYAAQTAFQANEDRVRVFSFVIANIATILTAIFAQTSFTAIPESLFKIILIALSLIGFMLIIQIARLRSSWIDSVRNMNNIKDYFITNSSNKEFAKAFKWRNKSVPSATKLTSISFLLTLIISFIDTISFGYGILLFLNGAELVTKFVICFVASFGFFALQLYAWAKVAKQ